ncbi:type III secretion system cytoplasmic ring protein SctQ [Burkholderia sp. WSM2232]|uniref:type III secretion system cytoplasmic ring protein SctQ n=1 Tax=Burkholderia sp. WSM2232 TaxID=944436 RepID=UPI0004877268|nr:type III secretion system cytoplasmic ring protein SctQ [Burkholderia sp. WSM2232]
MKMHEWTQDDLTLAVAKRGGADATRDEHAVSFGYRQLGGEGLILNLSVNGRDVRAWVAEAEFCNWVAPVLTAPSFDAFPVDLTAAVAAWALAPFAGFVLERDLGLVAVSAIARGACPVAFDCTITLAREDARLAIRPLEWDVDVLRHIAAATPRAALDAAHTLSISLVAGWAWLKQYQLEALNTGDAIVLDVAADVNKGEAWMFKGGPLAKIVSLEPAWRVENVMNRIETQISSLMAAGVHELPDGPAQRAEPRKRPESPDMDDSHAMPDVQEAGQSHARCAATLLDDVPFALTAEIASMDVPLAALRDLAPGQVLDPCMSADGRVSLKVNGTVIGLGRLIRMGGRLLVRIE